MSKVADFAQNQYDRMFSDYAEEFPNEKGIQNSVTCFSLMLGQFIAETMHQNPNLPDDYHSVMLEMISEHTKFYIDAARKNENLTNINWDTGNEILSDN